MADTTLNRFLATGTTAQRTAFTPSPPTPASGPTPEYLWWDTSLQVLYAWNAGSSAWVAVAATTTLRTRAITFAIDGGGSALTTGIKADIYVPYACTITGVTMLADQSGSVVVDIWKQVYGSYPPTIANTITASALPTITTALKSQDNTLTGWTTAIAAGDTLRFNINSATSITRLALTLTVLV